MKPSAKTIFARVLASALVVLPCGFSGCGGGGDVKSAESTSVLETGVPIAGSESSGEKKSSRGRGARKVRASRTVRGQRWNHILALFREDEEDDRLAFFDQKTEADQENFLRRKGKIREYELRQLLREGMTMDQVARELGPPNHRVSHPSKSVLSPRWTYKEFNGADFLYYTLNFQDGILRDWFLTIPSIEHTKGYAPARDPLKNIFPKRLFAFSGTFNDATGDNMVAQNTARRMRLQDWIKKAGGQISPRITPDVDYVVIGNGYENDANFEIARKNWIDTLNIAQLRHYLESMGVDTSEYNR